MSASIIKPFIKWAGGKSRVLPELLAHLPKRECLIEPFAGGAAVFLGTDYRRYILGDINPDLINLYRSAMCYPDILINAARDLFAGKNSEQGYYEVRAAFNKDGGKVRSGGLRYGLKMSRIMRAAQFLYLNRHGYNGLCRYSRKTGFNVPYGHFKAPFFPEHDIRLFAEKANDTKAIFICAPFSHSIKLAATDAAIYCDPPYLPASNTADFTSYYEDAFTEADHRQLVNELIDINRQYAVPVVISNSDTAETREIYSPFTLHQISVQRSAGAKKETRKKAGEVIGVLTNKEVF